MHGLTRGRVVGSGWNRGVYLRPGVGPNAIGLHGSNCSTGKPLQVYAFRPPSGEFADNGTTF